MSNPRLRFLMTLDEFTRVNIEKHYGGGHDQKTHGNWATGGGDSLGQTSLTPQQLKDFRDGSAMRHIRTDSDGNVVFTKERQKLHDDYVRKAVENIPRSDNPTFYMLGGGPASGKTTMIRNAKIPLPDGTKAVQINPDDAKAILPEYEEAVARRDVGAAAFVHEESSYLSKRVQRAAYERGLDVVLDGTGDASREGLTAKIDGALQKGYKVVGFYATVPTEVAIQRANERAEKPGPNQGRYIDPNYVAAIHRSVSDVFPIAIEKMAEVSLYDNTRGSKLVLKAKDGRVTFVDDKAYAAFLKKGK